VIAGTFVVLNLMDKSGERAFEQLRRRRGEQKENAPDENPIPSGASSIVEPYSLICMEAFSAFAMRSFVSSR
jgi:hypothetical protein